TNSSNLPFSYILRVPFTIIMIFCLKRLHRNDNYAWPIVAIVVGVLGSILYIIPGIWALMINNSAQNRHRNTIN
ncbi:MAG: hypothetical protein ABF547_00225, partial [Lentilactobacillus hilgardii]